MRIVPKLVIVAILLSAAASPVFAWWSGGHRILTLAAVSKLPADMPEFFRESGKELADMSVEPDNWKNITTPHLRTTEQPEHYIDLEYLEGEPLPDQRADLMKIYKSRNIEPGKGGFLPYALIEGYERLLLSFRDLRSGRNDEAVKHRIVVYAGWLAHYSGDASMPLHTTVNYDGKPGKDGKLMQKGIHARIDGYPEKNGFTPEMVAEGLAPKQDAHAWPLILAALDASHAQVEKCYELDQAGAFDGQPDKGKELMLDRSKAGAQLILDLWYLAWKNSDPKNVIK